MYKGWSNEETHTVAVHLTYQRDIYEDLRREITPDVETTARNFRDLLEDRLGIEGNSQYGMLTAELLFLAMQHINWQELAEHFQGEGIE